MIFISFFISLFSLIFWEEVYNSGPDDTDWHYRPHTGIEKREPDADSGAYQTKQNSNNDSHNLTSFIHRILPLKKES